jgi:hypothetical protein
LQGLGTSQEHFIFNQPPFPCLPASTGPQARTLPDKTGQVPRTGDGRLGGQGAINVAKKHKVTATRYQKDNQHDWHTTNRNLVSTVTDTVQITSTDTDASLPATLAWLEARVNSQLLSAPQPYIISANDVMEASATTNIINQVQCQ